MAPQAGIQISVTGMQVIIVDNMFSYRLAYPGSLVSNDDFYDYYDACG